MAFSEVNRLVSERVPLDRIVSKYTKLEQSSRGYIALCPFHNEKTPSFHIYTDNNTYYCFGCGASGNAVTFLMEKENLSFGETLQKIGEEFKIPELLEREKRSDPQLENEREEIFQTNLAAEKIFMRNLAQSSEAQSYLNRRQISPEMQKHFGIGSATTNQQFLDEMQSQNIGMNAMLRAGLIRVDDSGRPVSYFRNRIMFPIIDKKRIIGFGGRIMTDEKPKYINSPDTIVFHKKEHLFGLDFLRSGLREFPFIVLCEGYFDVVAMHQHGLETAVAALGTAVSENHLEILSRFNKPLVLLLDGYDAGRHAATRISTLQIPENLDLRVAFIQQEGEDPDSLLKKEGGREIIKNLVENSNPLFQHLIDEQIELYFTTENIEEKIKIETGIREILKRLPRVKFEHYSRYVRSKTQSEVRISIPVDTKNMLAKAENGSLKKRERQGDETTERLKRILYLATVAEELVNALETIKKSFIANDLGDAYDLILRIHDEGGDYAPVREMLDRSGTISNEFDGKSIDFIERFFDRAVASTELEEHNLLLQKLYGDNSPEARRVIKEIIEKNNKLKMIIKNNQIESLPTNQ